MQKILPHVRRVIDAKEDAQIEVTKSDVSWAARKNHGHCAMARACERSAGADAALVTPYRAFLVRGDTAVRYSVSTAARAEIVAFDRGHGFMPGTYDLKAPSQSELLGAPRGTRKANRGGKNQKRHYRLTKGVRAIIKNLK